MAANKHSNRDSNRNWRILLRRLVKLTLLLVSISVLLFSVGTDAYCKAGPEYQIKAGYIYRFLSFIEWPESAFKKPDQPFTIGILGRNPFGDLFQPIAGTIVNGRTITIRYLPENANAVEIRQCQVLFVAPDRKEMIAAVLDSIDGAPVLTVGETPGFLEQGGMINFVIQDNKIRFEINDAAVEPSGLKIRSMMKRLATRILGGGHASE